MKKNIFLAVVGAAALAGCTSNEVMKERGFVPAPKDDAEISATAPKAGTVPAMENPQRRPAPRKAADEFPPMTGDFGGKGLDSSASDASSASGEYVVRRGDTLGKIAAAHRVRLSALMEANKLTEKDAKRLQVGRKLVIPSGKAAQSAVSGKRAKTERKGGRMFGAKAGKTSIQPGEYTVKSGDTPERIARRAGVRLSALMEANNLTEKEARHLRIGQKLVIPAGGKAVKSDAKVKAAKTDAKAQAEAVKTEVKAAEPAKAASNSGDELMNEMNKAEVKDSAASAAAVPETAVAPAAAEESEVVVASADISLADFARQHNTTADALRKLNSDLSGDKIKSGAVVLVPKR